VLTQSSAGQDAGLPSTDLELVNYGAGYGWFRRELDAAIRDADDVDQVLTRRLGWPEPQPEPEERVALTDLGRRALAMERLFGPWPRLVDSVCCGCGAVLRPGVNIHYRTPDGRTHCDGCATAGDVEYQPTTPPAEVPAA
jgi:hypothetical protein